MAKSGFLAGTLRWLKRIGLGLLALLAVVVLAGAGYELYARHKAHQEYPPPGQLVDIGGRKMHIDCRGEGSPTVVLESGLDSNGSMAWVSVHDQLARLTRTCAYDRAGVMWSEPKSTPQHADAVAQDLHATLAAAGVNGPLVMVCHSLGGPYIMSYVRQFPDNVKGMVFVDCSHPDQMQRMPEAIVATMRTPMTYKVLSALSWTGVFRLLPQPEYFDMPDSVKTVGKAYLGETFHATLAEMKAMPQSLEQGGGLRDLGDRPLVVLTAMAPIPEDLLTPFGLTTDDAQQMQDVWTELSADEASWSSRSRQQDVPDSLHYIQFQRPDLVIDAVAEVLEQVARDQ